MRDNGDFVKFTRVLRSGSVIDGFYKSSLVAVVDILVAVSVLAKFISFIFRKRLTVLCRRLVNIIHTYIIGTYYS